MTGPPEVVLLATLSAGGCGAVKLEHHLKQTTPSWSVQAGSQTQRSLKLTATAHNLCCMKSAPQVVILPGFLSDRMYLNVIISEERAAHRSQHGRLSPRKGILCVFCLGCVDLYHTAFCEKRPSGRKSSRLLLLPSVSVAEVVSRDFYPGGSGFYVITVRFHFLFFFVCAPSLVQKLGCSEENMTVLRVFTLNSAKYWVQTVWRPLNHAELWPLRHDRR